MIYQQDWIIKQIENMVQMIAKIIFKKDVVTYTVTNNEVNTGKDLLYTELLELLSSLKINQAENLLFNNIKTSDWDYLKIAMDFYTKLNKLSDEELAEADFSREEIKNGLEEILKMFGVLFWE